MEEEQLFEKIKRGDKTAYTQLMQSMRNLMYNMARIRLGNYEDDINDVIQETMILSYKHVHKLKNVKVLKTWIIKILINECNKIYKKNSKYITLCNDAITNLKAYKEHDIETVDDKLVLDKAVKCLSEEERMILQLYYYDYSIKEMARIFRMNENTVKSKIARSKEKIRKYLEEKDEQC